MARELQTRVLDLLEAVAETSLQRETCPAWLRRPGAAECGQRWPVIQVIYRDPTGGELPEVMPIRERRRLDAVLTSAGGTPRIVEIDEAQHFTRPRARTFAHYPAQTATAFDQHTWQRRAAAATAVRGGGWGRQCTPLFPDPGGRHLQRAFRDALADLLPEAHEWAPTLATRSITPRPRSRTRIRSTASSAYSQSLTSKSPIRVGTPLDCTLPLQPWRARTFSSLSGLQ